MFTCSCCLYFMIDWLTYIHCRWLVLLPSYTWTRLSIETWSLAMSSSSHSVSSARYVSISFPFPIPRHWSCITNLHSQVNAKLSDYGIACYATESGLTQPMGTAGWKAPELLAANTSYMSYNDKVSFFHLHRSCDCHMIYYYTCPLYLWSGGYLFVWFAAVCDDD